MRAYHRVDPLMDERKSHYSPAQFGAFLKVQLMAGRQSRPGRFRSLQSLRDALPAAYSRLVDFLLEQGDLVVEAGGECVVDGWAEWQEGDLTVAERMARLRGRKRCSSTGGEGAPVTTTAEQSRDGDGRQRNGHRNGTLRKVTDSDTPRHLVPSCTSLPPSGIGVGSSVSTLPPSASPGDAPEGGRVGEHVQELQKALAGHGVFTRSPDRQRVIALHLDGDGATVMDLDDLAKEAASGQNPSALLASWLEQPGKWRQVLDDRRTTPPLVYGESDPGGRVVPDQADTQRRLARDRAIAARSEWEAKHLPKPPGLRATQAEREAWQRACDETRVKLAAQGNRPPEVPK